MTTETPEASDALAAQLAALLHGEGDTLEVTRAQQAIHARIFGAGQPIRVARFELRERLGVGGMGVVHAAYDPELDRTVALKLLRVDRIAGVTDAAGLLRSEGRALAKLSHPNVVTVHEVGHFGPALYIAMELVDGPTLQRWLDEPRSVAEIVRMFADVGEGLAAAHGAGVVHRDFKPDNVLVGEDGRPRIVDFGLARVMDTNLAPLDVRISSRHSRAGGTPGYVAPEVLAGAPADAKSDQYAYCVTFYEALFGRLAEHENVEWPTRTASGDRAPRRLCRIVARGLVEDPKDRWPAMTTMVAELRRGRSQLAWWIGTTGVLALAGAAVAATTTDPEPCAEISENATSLWDPGSRDLVGATMRASGAASAETSIETALTIMDRRAGDWIDASVRICRATHVLHTQSPALMDVRMACLDQQRAAFVSAKNLLGEGDPLVVSKSVAIASALEPARRCESAAMLDVPAPPPGREQEVAQARARLADAHVRFVAARYTDVEAIAMEILADAGELGRATESEASLLLGYAQNEIGRIPEAEASFRRALIAAEAAGHDLLIAEVWCRLLMHAARYSPNDPQALADMTAHAQASVERLGDEPDAAAELDAALGWIAMHQGRPADARASFERALERGAAAGQDEYWLAGNTQRLAEAHYHLGQWDEAQRILGEALATRERLVGPDHPAVASTVMLLGSVHERRGDYDSALAQYLRALEIYDRAFPDGNADVAGALQNIGVVHLATRDLVDAERAFTRSVRIIEDDLGGESPLLFAPLLNMGIVQMLKGEHELARTWFQRALVIARRIAPVSANVAMVLGNFAECWLAEGRADIAYVYASEALVVWRQSVPDHPEEAHFLLFLADSALALGREDIAREPAERALKLRLRHPGDPGQLAHAQFTVARVKHGRAETRSESVGLGLAALTNLVASPDIELRARVVEWLTSVESRAR